MIIKKDDMPLDKSFPLNFICGDLPPGFNMGRVFHWHDCLEISYVVKGTGRYHIEGKIFEMKPGDFIVINNLEPHYLEVDNENMIQWVIIFEPSLIWSQSGSSMDYEYLSPFFEIGSDFNNRIDRSNQFSDEIIHNLLAIEQEFSNKPKAYHLMIKARLLLILSLLIRHFREGDKEIKTRATKRQQLIRLEAALKYIEENFSKDIDLGQVAAVSFMSPQYLSSYIKKVLGVNFTDYLNNIRVNNAVRMLKNSDDKITRIAMECGFNNTTTFNSIFKKFTGKTPTQLRGR